MQAIRGTDLYRRNATTGCPGSLTILQSLQADALSYARRNSPTVARLVRGANFREVKTMSALRTLLVTSLIMFSPALLAQQTAGERVDDAAIPARVKAALIEDETAKARNIDVETQSGIVQLSGFVESKESKRAAEAAARSVDGVTEVRSALIVRGGDRTVVAVVYDPVIAAKVKAQIADEAGLGTASAVNVEVNSGVVQLSGFVNPEDEKSRAETVASSVDGVANVRDDIAVQR